jgi:hypothetical protein
MLFFFNRLKVKDSNLLHLLFSAYFIFPFLKTVTYEELEVWRNNIQNTTGMRGAWEERWVGEDQYSSFLAPLTPYNVATESTCSRR